MYEQLQKNLNNLLSEFIDEMYNHITEHERLVIELAMKRASLVTIDLFTKEKK